MRGQEDGVSAWIPRPPLCSRRLWATTASCCDREIDDLSDLTTGGIGAGAEVGPVVRIARFTRSPAGITADNVVAIRRLHELIEGGPRRHVGEAARRRVL